MKFCIKCGAQLTDDALFCTACGAKCNAASQHPEITPAAPLPTPQPDSPKVPKEKKPVQKGKMIAVISAIVLVICAAIGGFFAIRWYNSPEQQLLRALKAGQYEEALDILDEDSSLKYSENLSDNLKKRIATIKSDYIAATMEYASVMMELETIEKIDIKELRELIGQTREYVEKLNASRTAYATAESFFANAAYIEAIAQYKQVIQEDSNYATAVAKASEAMGLYRTKMLTDAEVYAASGNYANAITLLQDALNHLPEDAQLTQQILLYEKAQADQILKNALDEAAKYATAKDYVSAMRVLDQYTQEHGANAEISVARNTYDEANKALILSTALEEAAQLASGKDYLAAIDVLDQYLIWNGSNTEVSAMRSTYQNAYVDLVLADAAVYGDAGAYSNAIAVLNNALKEFPGNSKLTAQVTAYEKAFQAQQLSDALAKANAYADNKDYLSAINILNTYTGDYGTNASVVVVLTEYKDKYVNVVLAEAEKQYNDQDYVAAITTLRAGLINVPESSKLSVRLDTYTGVIVAELIAISDECLTKREFDVALEVVDTGLELLPGNRDLLAQANKILDVMPKNFVDVLDPFQSSHYKEYPVGATFNMSGEERTNGLVWWYSSGDSYAYFNLGQRYTKLSFDFGHIDGTKMDSADLKIYLDGVLVVDITFIAGDPPKHIEIDVSNVQELQISVYMFFWNDNGHYGMADMIIE